MADPPLRIEDIHRLLPHRYPMVMIDRVLEVTADTVVAEKVVSANEPYLQGHFPGRPIMPGVLLIEAIAQAAGVAVRLTRQPKDPSKKGVALVGVEKARFRRPVVPGDTVRIEVRLLQARADLFRAAGSASVNGVRVMEAEILAAFVDWGGGT
jgi:3-hydroxyacyl-[acyl-carrier-protein] dehydratase